MKKLVKVVFAFVTVLFLVFGLLGCKPNEKLISDQKQGVDEIVNYANSKGKDNYNKNNWNLITEILNEAKNSFNKTKDRNEIINLITVIKDEIDLVKSNSMIEILKGFDLSDPKVPWIQYDNTRFNTDFILIILKKTLTYEELELKDFSINIGVSLNYIGGSYPPEHFFAEGNENLLANYRQIVMIGVDTQDKEKLVAAVRKIERLEFVKQATPNIIEYGGV